MAITCWGFQWLWMASKNPEHAWVWFWFYWMFYDHFSARQNTHGVYWYFTIVSKGVCLRVVRDWRFQQLKMVECNNHKWTHPNIMNMLFVCIYVCWCILYKLQYALLYIHTSISLNNKMNQKIFCINYKKYINGFNWNWSIWNWNWYWNWYIWCGFYQMELTKNGIDPMSGLETMIDGQCQMVQWAMVSTKWPLFMVQCVKYYKFSWNCKITGLVHNFIIPANCWNHVWRSKSNGSMSYGVHKKVFCMDGRYYQVPTGLRRGTKTYYR